MVFKYLRKHGNWKKTGVWLSPVWSYIYFQSCRLDLQTLVMQQEHVITFLAACAITSPLNTLLKSWLVTSLTLLSLLLQLQNISQGSGILSQIYILTLTLIVPTHWSLQLFEACLDTMVVTKRSQCRLLNLHYAC